MCVNSGNVIFFSTWVIFINQFSLLIIVFILISYFTEESKLSKYSLRHISPLCISPLLVHPVFTGHILKSREILSTRTPRCREEILIKSVPELTSHLGDICKRR